jgi:probable HAF family extracellular repeat protein
LSQFYSFGENYSERRTKVRNRLIQLSIAAGTVAGIGPIAAAGPTIYSLDVANNGSTGSRGLAINDSGQVAVSSLMLFGQGTPQRYDGQPGAGGVLRDLIVLPGDQTGFANAINSSGQVAGYSQGATVFTPAHAFRYDGTPGAGGVVRPLGTLGGDSSEGLGINDLGQLTGVSKSNPSGPNPGTYAFIYTGTPGAGGVMKSLGSLGGTTSSGVAINNAGQVAGYSLLGDNATFHAFRYDGLPGTGTMRDLGTLPGYTISHATAINASGQVAGSVETADTGHAFIYKGTPGIDGVMIDLGTLPGGTISAAVGLTNAGYVLGISDRAGDTEFHPALWRPDGSVIDLEEWLDAANPAQGAQWNLTDAFITGISNTGLITGDGIYTAPGEAFGNERAFILDASSLVPEPSSVVMLMAATLLIRRRKHAA